MRIAFISYEFPPDTAFGGIATYTYFMAESLVKLGCKVEVFSASHHRETRHELYQNILVHRLHTGKREAFAKAIVPVITERHQQEPFDLIESPEYGAEGAFVREALPTVPFVVKFHTPSFVIKSFNRALKAHRLKYKVKNFLKIGEYKKEDDPEYRLALRATALVAPSQSVAEMVSEKWGIAREKITVLPSPFIAQPALLDIPAETATNTITYLGRLEGRKGVHLLAKAIPPVLEKFPGATFRFIGRTNIGPFGKGTMLEHLKALLQPWLHRIEFIDHVPSEEVPGWLAKTDICVFPSLWEAYGYVCVEAMSAARGVIASKYGGMYEMLVDIDESLLVDPKDTAQLANALIHLLEHPQKRMALGEKSREKTINFYGIEAPQRNLAFYKTLLGKQDV
jgi:glycosyltransferase involved in cell wall biosynthesis